MPTTPADVEAAVQEMADCGMPGIDPRIMAEVLNSHPHLGFKATEWGWHDTEVRDSLFVLLWSHLTGGHPDARLEESERERQIYAAQREWQARNEGAL
jgi:hypothetical protein